MTDRTHKLVVTLDRDYRTDDVEGLVAAIQRLRGVADVRVDVNTPDDELALIRARHELRSKLGKVLWPELYGREDADV